MPTPYINKTEYLLVKIVSKVGPYIQESPKQVFATIQDILPEVDDGWATVWRFDEVTGTGEDITEDLAKAYVDATPETGEDTAPLFVKNSEALENMLSERTPPINMRRMYGTYQTYRGRVA